MSYACGLWRVGGLLFIRLALALSAEAVRQMMAMMIAPCDLLHIALMPSMFMQFSSNWIAKTDKGLRYAPTPPANEVPPTTQPQLTVIAVASP